MSALVVNIILLLAGLAVSILGTAILVGKVVALIMNQPNNFVTFSSPGKIPLYITLLWLILVICVTGGLVWLNVTKNVLFIPTVATIWSAVQGTVFGVVGHLKIRN
jgi:hypothetical protein